jgi:hypothetical protein
MQCMTMAAISCPTPIPRQQLAAMPAEDQTAGACRCGVNRSTSTAAKASLPSLRSQRTRSPLCLLLVELLGVGAPQSTHPAGAVAQHACGRSRGRGRAQTGILSIEQWQIYTSGESNASA